MKRFFLGVGLLFSITAHGQIRVDQAGDDWKSLVDSALTKIKQSDISTWNFILEHVKHIGFWNGAFSTTEFNAQGTWSVVISASDIRLGSINNLASVITHESYHVYAATHNLQLTPCQEELAAYSFEQSFQRRLKNLESWISRSTTHQVITCQKRLEADSCK